MDFYFDTEFAEDFKKPINWLPKGSLNKPYYFVDLISIGIFCKKDGKEHTYYTVNKDADIDWIWNLYDVMTSESSRLKPDEMKYYWIRVNVLRKIWEEFEYMEYRVNPNDIKEDYYQILDGLPTNKERIRFYIDEMCRIPSCTPEFTLSRLKYLIDKFGKTRKQIAYEIKKFVYSVSEINDPLSIANWKDAKHLFPLNFYSYYGSYDWQLLCSLYGGIKKLPLGFPKYTKDLKYLVDEFVRTKFHIETTFEMDFETKLNVFKCLHIGDASYPVEIDDHHALTDAIWNNKLHDFLKLADS